MELNKIPPHNLKSEQAVLGSLILSSELLTDVIKYIDRADYFYDTKHAVVYSAILSLNKKNNPIDLISLFKELKEESQIDGIGGAPFLNSLTNRIIYEQANLEYHALMIKQDYIKRQIILKSTALIEEAYNIDLDDALRVMNRNLDEIHTLTEGKVQTQTVGEIANDCLSQLETRCNNFKNGILNGIPTNSKQLDNLLGGLKKGLYILAGRPGMKKTAQALCMAKAAAKNGFKSAFFSLEMDALSLTDRVILSETEMFIDSVRYANGNLIKHEKDAVVSAAIQIRDYEIYLDPNPVVDVYYIGSTLRRMVRRGECDVAFIDYLQLVDTEKVRNENREREIAKVTRYLKLLSKELSIPIVLLAQLSRKVEERGNGCRPQLSDLRESGAIEQDADVVMFVYRPEKYGIIIDENGQSTKDMLVLIVDKHRNGMIGDVLCKSYPSPYNIIDANSINTTDH